MEAATSVQDGQPPESERDPAEKTVDQLFRFAAWVHVGSGAEGCGDVDEGEGTNACGNPLHFHAWLRLPNQFQHREIRDKAMAAKARKVRQLRDPDTDAGAVLEAELDELRHEGSKETIASELVGRGWYDDYQEAVHDVDERENDAGERLFAHIEQDQRRFSELSEKDEADRPKDEFEELAGHLADYQEQVQKRTEEIQAPRREGFEQREFEELLALYRDHRIDTEATAEFMHDYNVWEWYLGTLDRPRGERRFRSREHMQDAAPEVIEAIQQTFDDLERSVQRGKLGNL